MSEADDIYFFSVLALIFVPLGTWLVISDFKNRAFPKSRDLNISIRSWGALVIGVFILLFLLLTTKALVTPLLVSVSYLLVSAYILLLRPSFKYANDEKEKIPSFQSFDDGNKLFLLIVAIVFLIFSLVILLIIGIRLFSGAA